MKQKLIFSSKVANLVLSWFNFVMFFSMRCCWSGISKTLGYESNYAWILLNLPVFIFFLFFAVFIANVCMYMLVKKESNLWSYICNGFNIVFLIVILVIIKLGAVDYMRFVWPAFFTYLGITIAILALVFMIFIYPKTPLKECKYFKLGTMGIVGVWLVLYLFNISFNRITCGANVYAVEKEYQVVFSSSTESRAWVEVDGVRYFDNYNGVNRTYTKIHKVSVPMEVLDNAGHYKIHVQKLTYRGPFGGYFGRDISKEYSFRPVSAEDGIKYYSLSDIHMAGKASAKTVSYFNDIDFFVLAGDIVSMMDSFVDANLTNVYAHQITKGNIPIVYARGNHELKGKYAEEFHNFVGTNHGNFYYNIYLDNTFITVLDIGEDHDDDWWEYYDTAYYEEYREAQYKMLEDTYLSSEHLAYDYKLAVCHIPVVFVNNRHNHEIAKAKFTELLNKLEINMCISGHQHDLLIFEPGTVTPNEVLKYNKEFSSKKTYKGYLTDFNFVNLAVSKRGHTQTDSSNLTNMKSQIGTYISVDFGNKTQTVKFTDSLGKEINVVNPFADINYGKELVFSLKTNRIV